MLVSGYVDAYCNSLRVDSWFFFWVTAATNLITTGFSILILETLPSPKFFKYLKSVATSYFRFSTPFVVSGDRRQ